MSVDEYLRFNTRLDRKQLMSLVRNEQRREDDMVARARGTSLLDGVLEFELFLDRARQWSGFPGVRRLTRDEVFAGRDPEAVRQAQLRARALLDDAERYGDDAHRRRTPQDNERLQAEMRREHPGFSDKSYTDVLMRGMFLMR
jgi:hypothetical protein